MVRVTYLSADCKKNKQKKKNPNNNNNNKNKTKKKNLHFFSDMLQENMLYVCPVSYILQNSATTKVIV